MEKMSIIKGIMGRHNPPTDGPQTIGGLGMPTPKVVENMHVNVPPCKLHY